MQLGWLPKRVGEIQGSPPHGMRPPRSAPGRTDGQGSNPAGQGWCSRPEVHRLLLCWFPSSRWDDLVVWLVARVIPPNGLCDVTLPLFGSKPKLWIFGEIFHSG